MRCSDHGKCVGNNSDDGKFNELRRSIPCLRVAVNAAYGTVQEQICNVRVGQGRNVRRQVSKLNLRPKLDDAVGRDLEEGRRRVRVAEHPVEQDLPPVRHPRMLRKR